jgi:hypothetical protein
MKASVSAMIFTLLLSGCTATIGVGGNTGSHERKHLTYGELQDRLRDKSVCVILNDNRMIQGTIGGISRDSLRLSGDDDMQPIAFSTSNVCCIEKTNHVKGGILGFLGGTYGGATLGMLVGEIVEGDFRSPGNSLLTFAGGTLGLVGGTLYGAIHGHVDRYEFEGDSLHVTMK